MIRSTYYIRRLMDVRILLCSMTMLVCTLYYVENCCDLIKKGWTVFIAPERFLSVGRSIIDTTEIAG